MKKIHCIKLVFFLCLITLSNISAKFDKKFLAAKKGCFDMSLAFSDWSKITINKNPFVCYDIKNDTSLFIFSVYKNNLYLGYVAVNASDDRPIYEEVTTRIHPQKQLEANKSKIFSLLRLNDERIKSIKIVYIASDYYINTSSESSKVFLDIFNFNIFSYDSIRILDARYAELLIQEKNKFQTDWTELNYSTQKIEKSIASTNILSGVSNYYWYRGCYPTAMAMVFNYLATRPGLGGLAHSSGTITWSGPYSNPRFTSQNLVDHFANYYSLPSSGGTPENYAVDTSVQPSSVVNVGINHSYRFSSSYYSSETASQIRHEIDNFRPFKVGGSGHSSFAYGYTDNGESVYRFDTYQNGFVTPRTNMYVQNMTTAIPHITVPDNVSNLTQAFQYTYQDEKVYTRSLSLSQDLVIPDGEILVIMTGSTISLNGYNIRCQGSGKIEKQGVVTGYNAYANSGSDYKGFFPSSTTLQQILSWASSGWNIVLSSGTYDNSDHLTINSGISLSINSGVTLKFASGKKLTVNGTISANGTSSQKVTFQPSSGTWYGIEVNYSGYTPFKYCSIKNATCGIRAYQTSNLYIENCEITNNNNGVTYDNQSSGYVRYSKINSNLGNSGINCSQNSNPLIRSYNQLKNNTPAGLFGDYNSLPELGSWAYNGNNSISNSYDDVWSENSNSVYALYNYWGSSSPNPYVSENIIWEPYLTSDPTGGSLNKLLAEELITTDRDTTGKTEFAQAYQAWLKADYLLAIQLF